MSQVSLLLNPDFHTVCNENKEATVVHTVKFEMDQMCVTFSLTPHVNIVINWTDYFCSHLTPCPMSSVLLYVLYRMV